MYHRWRRANPVLAAGPNPMVEFRTDVERHIALGAPVDNVAPVKGGGRCPHDCTCRLCRERDKARLLRQTEDDEAKPVLGDCEPGT